MPRKPVSSIESLREALAQVDKRVQTAGYSLDLEPAIQELHEACQAAKWDEGIVRAMQLLMNLETLKPNSGKARELYNEAIKFGEERSLEDLLFDAYIWNARTYIYGQKRREGFHIFKELLARAVLQKKQYYIANCKYYLGVVSQRYSFDEDALKYFRDALKITKEQNFLKIEGSIINNLAELFLTRYEFAAAEKNAVEYLKIQNLLGLPTEILRAQVRLLTILLETKKDDEAETLLTMIDKNADQLYLADRGTLLLCKAKFAFKKEKYDLAAKTYKKAIKHFEQFGPPRLLANALSVTCEMYLELKDAEQSVLHAKRALQFVDHEQDDFIATEVYRFMYSASKLANDSVNALKYLELYNERLKKQEEQLLKTRIQFIELHSEYELRQAEVSSERKRSEELQIILEHKEKELTQKTRYLIKQTESLSQFRTDLKAIIRKVPSDDPLVHQVKDRIQSIPEDQLGWEEFDKQFKEVHPVYLSQLEKKYPTLTAMEKKLCSLLRLGLSSIDIAKLLYLSERNIENHRYRIRKKFDLPKEKNLHDFLASL